MSTCYTCSLLPGPAIVGNHEHSFDELAAAELRERTQLPRRSKALWDMVNRARSTVKR